MEPDKAYSAQSASLRRIALPLALGIHVAALFWWNSLMSRPSPSSTPVKVLSVSLIPSGGSAPAIDAQPPRAAASSRQREKLAEKAIPPQSEKAETMKETTRLKAESRPTEVPQDRVYRTDGLGALSSELGREIGRIDRETRRDFPARQHLGQSSSKTRLETSIETAGIQRNTTLEEVRSADGRRMTKVRTPYGTYCVVAGVNTGSNIADPIRNGVDVKMMSCPS